MTTKVQGLHRHSQDQQAFFFSVGDMQWLPSRLQEECNQNNSIPSQKAQYQNMAMTV